MPRRLTQVSPRIRTKIGKAKVARFATLDTKMLPHVVPVCFVYDGLAFYTPIDKKPKRVALEKLARIRHIRANPRVALLIDEYCEDWSQLWWILIRGKAKLIPKSASKEHTRAIRRLKSKYWQYRTGMLPDDAPVIRITPERIAFWGKF
jgi:PPOX class probable F420-dependent enzyme